MSRRREQLDPNVLELMHARGQIDQLFDALERDQFISSLGGRVRTKVFLSYSHKDAEILNALDNRLSRLPDLKLRTFDDRQITPGTRWRNTITREIATARVALLLISQDFLDSNFIQHAELPALLENEERDGLTVLPLFLEPCNLSTLPYLAQLQGINDPGAPLSALSIEERSAVLQQAVDTIAAALDSSR